MGTLTQSWRVSLNSAKRISWNTYANAVAMKNKLGETTYHSGFNHFIRANAIRLQSGKTRIDTGPVVLALPEKDPTITVAASVATQLFTLTYSLAEPWATESGAFLHISQGEPQNATRNFFAGPWKYAGKIDENVAPTYTVPAAYTLVLGQKTWLAIRICRADGRVSELMYSSCIVVD
jgi:hypothetical protein